MVRDNFKRRMNDCRHSLTGSNNAEDLGITYLNLLLQTAELEARGLLRIAYALIIKTPCSSVVCSGFPSFSRLAHSLQSLIFFIFILYFTVLFFEG